MNDCHRYSILTKLRSGITQCRRGALSSSSWSWMYLAIVVSITPCVSPMEQLIENIAFAVARAFDLTCPVMVSPSLETLLCSRRCGRRTKRPGFPKIPFLLATCPWKVGGKRFVSQDVYCGSFHGSQVCKTSPLLPKAPDGMYQNGSLYSIMPSKLCVLGAQRLHRRGMKRRACDSIRAHVRRNHNSPVGLAGPSSSSRECIRARPP